jgi:predicted RecA/RadA family phage recombinase
MAQTPALFYQEGDAIDYTPVAAVTAGDVIVTGNTVGIATNDIAANVQGSLTISGVFKVPKATGAIAKDAKVFWDADGSPNVGTASSGAATGTGMGNTRMGTAIAAAGSSDTYVNVLLTAANRSIPNDVAVTATTGGGTTGLIPAGSSFVTVTSDSANKQISLPAGQVDDVIKILVGTTACELISAVAADKVNEIVVGATNELALTAEALYTCTYTKSGFWIVTGETKLGARIAALVPDAL